MAPGRSLSLKASAASGAGDDGHSCRKRGRRYDMSCATVLSRNSTLCSPIVDTVTSPVTSPVTSAAGGRGEGRSRVLASGRSRQRRLLQGSRSPSRCSSPGSWATEAITLDVLGDLCARHGVLRGWVVGLGRVAKRFALRRPGNEPILTGPSVEQRGACRDRGERGGSPSSQAVRSPGRSVSKQRRRLAASWTRCAPRVPISRSTVRRCTSSSTRSRHPTQEGARPAL
jgi:hypothetical protein